MAMSGYGMYLECFDQVVTRCGCTLSDRNIQMLMIVCIGAFMLSLCVIYVAVTWEIIIPSRSWSWCLEILRDN